MMAVFTIQRVFFQRYPCQLRRVSDVLCSWWMHVSTLLIAMLSGEHKQNICQVLLSSLREFGERGFTETVSLGKKSSQRIVYASSCMNEEGCTGLIDLHWEELGCPVLVLHGCPRGLGHEACWSQTVTMVLFSQKLGINNRSFKTNNSNVSRGWGDWLQNKSIWGSILIPRKSSVGFLHAWKSQSGPGDHMSPYSILPPKPLHIISHERSSFKANAAKASWASILNLPEISKSTTWNSNPRPCKSTLMRIAMRCVRCSEINIGGVAWE